MKSAVLMLPLISGILWGAAGVFVRTLSASGMDSMTIVFTRVSFGSLMMLLLILAMDRSLLKVRREDVPLVIIAGISMIGVNVFYTITADTVSLSLAAVLLAMAPVFMLLMARFVFKEDITARKVASMLLAIVGCIMVSGLLESGEDFSPHGMAAGVMSAFLYALYGILSKRVSSRGYSVYTVLFYCMLVSFVCLIPLSDLGAVASFGAQGQWCWPFMALHALFASVLPFLLYNIGISRTEAGPVSIIASCGEPLSAAFFGFMFFSEVPSPLMVVGMAVVLVSITIMCAPHHRDRASSA